MLCTAALGSMALIEPSPAKDDSIKTLVGHHSAVAIARFHGGGAQVASGGNDGLVIHWDLRTDDQLWTHDYKSPVRGLAFSTDGKALARGGGGFARGEDGRHSGHEPVGEFVLRDPATTRAQLQRNGHTETISSVAFSPNGRVIVSTSLDKSLKFRRSGR